MESRSLFRNLGRKSVREKKLRCRILPEQKKWRECSVLEFMLMILHVLRHRPGERIRQMQPLSEGYWRKIGQDQKDQFSPALQRRSRRQISRRTHQAETKSVRQTVGSRDDSNHAEDRPAWGQTSSTPSREHQEFESTPRPGQNRTSSNNDPSDSRLAI